MNSNEDVYKRQLQMRAQVGHLRLGPVILDPPDATGGRDHNQVAAEDAVAVLEPVSYTHLDVYKRQR